jgi:hypothetical protein
MRQKEKIAQETRARTKKKNTPPSHTDKKTLRVIAKQTQISPKKTLKLKMVKKMKS